MTQHVTDSSCKNRTLQGLREGAIWGACIGSLRGIVKLFRSDNPWYLEVFGNAVALGIVAGVVCAIGKAVSGRLLGAWIGAVAGLFIGLWVGNALAGYEWTTETLSDGSRTATGHPVGQTYGMFIGLVLGAIAGSLIHRFAFHQLCPVDEPIAEQPSDE